ncbi:MAG: cyclic nucleotide-binding domain-containing protein [Bacteriovoracaceae bacterium]
MIEKTFIIHGVYYISIPEVGLNILCGCPADIVKHLIRLGLIKNTEQKEVVFETGPNAILLSDIPVQNGSFCNLAEFPVLQMLYRQGMILPNHPNNNGQKPLLIGTQNSVNAQLEYIYRGNYGLTSKEEIINAGVDEDWANEILRMKLKFAFGKIKKSSEFIDTVIVDDSQVEIKKGVNIKKVSTNQYTISYKGESVEIDLNLGQDQKYLPPYNLNYVQVKREHFSIVHSGDGDGWDINRPCMSSIVIYNGYIYLIDCPPNLLTTLNHLGIGVSEVRGVFHTHCHDDHFNGITTLMQADHRINYYATPLIRASVSKKISALLGAKGEILDKYFKIHDLEFDKWNEVEGLQVMPKFSPHPVETNNFIFRVISGEGFKTYAHLADISSFDVLNSMVVDDGSMPGISKAFYEKTKDQYLEQADIKKIDNGGGMIHGMAKDFKEDKTEKIILSHSSLDLTSEEKEIGVRSSFGLQDILIPSNAEQVSRFSKRFLNAHFPMVDFQDLRDLINCPIFSFNAGDMLMKREKSYDHIFLTLTGTVEMIDAKTNTTQPLPAGSLIGDISSTSNKKINKTYIAVGYVWVMKIPSNMFWDFAERLQINDIILSTQKKLSFFRSVPAFSEMAYSPQLNIIAQNVEKVDVKKGECIEKMERSFLYFILTGTVKVFYKGKDIGTLSEGDVLFEDQVLFKSDQSWFSAETLEDCSFYRISSSFLEDIPAARWRLYEIFEKRIEK